MRRGGGAGRLRRASALGGRYFHRLHQRGADCGQPAGPTRCRFAHVLGNCHAAAAAAHSALGTRRRAGLDSRAPATPACGHAGASRHTRRSAGLFSAALAARRQQPGEGQLLRHRAAARHAGKAGRFRPAQQRRNPHQRGRGECAQRQPSGVRQRRDAARPRAHHGLGRAAAGFSGGGDRRRVLLGRRAGVEHALVAGAGRPSQPPHPGVPGRSMERGGRGAQNPARRGRAAERHPVFQPYAHHHLHPAAGAAAASHSARFAAAHSARQTRRVVRTGAGNGAGQTLQRHPPDLPRQSLRRSGQGLRLRPRRNALALAKRPRRHAPHPRPPGLVRSAQRRAGLRHPRRTHAGLSRCSFRASAK